MFNYVSLFWGLLGDAAGVARRGRATRSEFKSRSELQAASLIGNLLIGNSSGHAGYYPLLS